MSMPRMPRLTACSSRFQSAPNRCRHEDNASVSSAHTVLQQWCGDGRRVHAGCRRHVGEVNRMPRKQVRKHRTCGAVGGELLLRSAYFDRLAMVLHTRWKASHTQHCPRRAEHTARGHLPWRRSLLLPSGKVVTDRMVLDTETGRATFIAEPELRLLVQSWSPNAGGQGVVGSNRASPTAETRASGLGIHPGQEALRRSGDDLAHDPIVRQVPSTNTAHAPAPRAAAWAFSPASTSRSSPQHCSPSLEAGSRPVPWREGVSCSYRRAEWPGTMVVTTLCTNHSSGPRRIQCRHSTDTPSSTATAMARWTNDTAFGSPISDR